MPATRRPDLAGPDDSHRLAVQLVGAVANPAAVLASLPYQVHVLDLVEQHHEDILGQRTGVNAAGSRYDQVRLLQPHSDDHLPDPGARRLDPLQVRRGIEHHLALQRAAREIEEYVGPSDIGIPARLLLLVQCEPGDAVVVGDIAHRRQQIRLVDHLHPLRINRPQPLDVFRFER